jgi:hypothetical protein
MKQVEAEKLWGVDFYMGGGFDRFVSSLLSVLLAVDG